MTTMPIERQPVNSEALRSVGYDPMTQTLEVEFSSGHVYRYPGVTQDEYQALMAAPSLGKHFHKQIRANHTGEKV